MTALQPTRPAHYPTNRNTLIRRARQAVLASLWVTLLALTLAGCGPQQAAPAPTSTSTSTTAAAASTTTTDIAANTPTTAAAPETTAIATNTTTAAAAAPTASEAPAATVTTSAAGAATPGTTATGTSVEAGAGTFQNPVFRTDFPDPQILKEGDTYYAYATNASGRNIQTATSKDLVHWELQREALPATGTWAKLGGSYVWAPEVIKIGNRYVLYYTARDKKSNKQCIGVAVGDNPLGLFKDPNDHPFVCQPDEGGSIDPDPFRDGDKLYFYWKNDGNCCSLPTYLYVQELAPDGLSLLGQPARLVRNDKLWEGGVVEAPTMWKQDGKYYLFFSANSYSGFQYAVGYANCQSPLGPCEDAPENPILASSENNPPVIGPGHQTIVVDAKGQTWMVYHAWEVNKSGTRSSRRFMWLDRLEWKDGKPDVVGPTQAVQPAPATSANP